MSCPVIWHGILVPVTGTMVMWHAMSYDWYIPVIICILATPIMISSVGPSISNVTFDIEEIDIECSFDIDVLHLRYRMSISKVFDIESISKVMDRVVDIEVSCLRYRTNTLRNCMLISYTIFLTFDIEGHVIIYWFWYRIQYSIHPMSFTAERKLPLPRLHHACGEESQQHVPWIPALSFPAIPQLDDALIHRDLTRKGPSIAPHPHVHFQKLAPCPAVGSWRIRCSFPWDLTPEAVRNCIDWVACYLEGLFSQIFDHFTYTGVMCRRVEKVRLVWNQGERRKFLNGLRLWKRTVPAGIADVPRWARIITPAHRRNFW
jgi:hypothetical protein